MAQPVQITVFEPHPRAANCRFVLDRPVASGMRVGFTSPEEARGNALFERLLAIEHVTAAAAEHDTVLLWKAADAEWPAILEAARWILRDWFAHEAPEGSSPPEGESQAERERRIRLAVEDVLEREVNPGIAAHGGRIHLLDVKDTVVYVRMEGGCQGCGMSAFTLKRGVLSSVRAKAPDVSAILDTTDHAAGTNPYYVAARV